MAGTDVCVKGEPYTDTEMTLEVLDVSEIKMEIGKCEVSAAEEHSPLENTCNNICGEKPEKPVNKCTISSSCNIGSKEQELVSKCPTTYFRSNAGIRSSYYSANMIINSTRNLLHDFYLMSQCRNSLYCSKVPFSPTVVMCNHCGKHFIGIGVRFWKLSIHIESKHRLIAESLLLDMVKRYSASLERMKKFLHMDRVFIAHHFD